MELNDQAPADAPDSTVDAGAEDQTDWKAKAIEFETKYKAENGVRRRVEKDLKKFQTTTVTEPQTESQPQDKQAFDYGQLAFLNSKGVTHDEDQAWIENLVKESGTELRALLGKDWVKSELKERQEKRATAAAVPQGGKRSGNQTSDTVDYWLTKIEAGSATVKDIPDQALRQKVVVERVNRAKSKGNFYNS